MQNISSVSAFTTTRKEVTDLCLILFFCVVCTYLRNKSWAKERHITRSDRSFNVYEIESIGNLHNKCVGTFFRGAMLPVVTGRILRFRARALKLGLWGSSPWVVEASSSLNLSGSRCGPTSDRPCRGTVGLDLRIRCLKASMSSSSRNLCWLTLTLVREWRKTRRMRESGTKYLDPSFGNRPVVVRTS